MDGHDNVGFDLNASDDDDDYDDSGDGCGDSVETCFKNRFSNFFIASFHKAKEIFEVKTSIKHHIALDWNTILHLT